jgi:hypothetical protein
VAHAVSHRTPAALIGYVIAWRRVVDPERVLEQEGRGRRLDARLA